MWCPKCRNEYRKGITVCADCGCPLVESLEEYDRQQTMKAADDENAVLLSEQEAQSADYTPAETDDEPVGGDTLPEEDSQDIGARLDATPYKKEHKHTYAYRDSSEKAEENKSSAVALLGVGIAGLIFIVLLFLGKVPFLTMNGANRYFICGVMGVMFILFIVMGIVSMKSFKRLKAEAASEHSIEEEIRKWCNLNLSADAIDVVLSKEETDDVPDLDSPETAYFARSKVIRERIRSQFVGLDEDFLDHFVDDYYSTLYGDSKTDTSIEFSDHYEDID